MYSLVQRSSEQNLHMLQAPVNSSISGPYNLRCQLQLFRRDTSHDKSEAFLVPSATYSSCAREPHARQGLLRRSAGLGLALPDRARLARSGLLGCIKQDGCLYGYAYLVNACWASWVMSTGFVHFGSHLPRHSQTLSPRQIACKHSCPQGRALSFSCFALDPCPVLQRQMGAELANQMRPLDLQKQLTA